MELDSVISGQTGEMSVMVWQASGTTQDVGIGVE